MAVPCPRHTQSRITGLPHRKQCIHSSHIRHFLTGKEAHSHVGWTLTIDSLPGWVSRLYHPLILFCIVL